jgi:predicted CoA-binding protein
MKPDTHYICDACTLNYLLAYFPGMKKTVVIGASPDPGRYSNIVCQMLSEAGHEFVPIGIRRGHINGQGILDMRQKPPVENVHTVTIYLNPKNQEEWYDYILSLNPHRIIFNPGTENPVFARKATEHGIYTEFACNLVLLSTGQF